MQLVNQWINPPKLLIVETQTADQCGQRLELNAPETTDDSDEVEASSCTISFPQSESIASVRKKATQVTGMTAWQTDKMQSINQSTEPSSTQISINRPIEASKKSGNQSINQSPIHMRRWKFLFNLEQNVQSSSAWTEWNSGKGASSSKSLSLMRGWFSATVKGKKARKSSHTNNEQGSKGKSLLQTTYCDCSISPSRPVQGTDQSCLFSKKRPKWNVNHQLKNLTNLNKVYTRLFDWLLDLMSCDSFLFFGIFTDLPLSRFARSTSSAVMFVEASWNTLR